MGSGARVLSGYLRPGGHYPENMPSSGNFVSSNLFEILSLWKSICKYLFLLS